MEAKNPTVERALEALRAICQEPPVRTDTSFADEVDPDPLDDLRRPFVDWFNASIRLDVEWLTRCRPGPRWCTGVNALHANCCDWMIEQDQVPPTPAEFRQLILEAGCALCTVGNVQLVLGGALKADVEAVRSFNHH
jgi:hypothetical protein